MALTVLDQLPYEPSFRGHITIEQVAWDKKGAGAPILANMTPQDSIKLGLPTPAECDIVVVIFWSRMGTPLPSQYSRADGSHYLSGTEWEYENAIEASNKPDGPAVLLYRRTEPLLLNPDDPKFEEKTNQYRLVKQFFDSLVDADGSFKGGYNTYKTPSDFKEALELHLKSLIEKIIRSPKSTANSPQTLPPAWPTSPFPGLRAFKAADAPIFFGRERETDALVKRVEENPVVAIVGASGSGKSSLVGAGLIPRLLLTTSNEGWLPITTTPDYLGSGNPFSALAASLLRDLGSVEQRELATALSKNSKLLGEICREALDRRPSQARVLLFIDQFEELFTTIAPNYRPAYVDTLVQTAASDRIRVVITLRGDFYGKCVELPQLAKLLEESTYPLSVPGMAALYEMITRPASRADLHFEDGLAQRILDDTGDEPGSLALMAYTLDELYRLSTSSERLLTHSAYEELGGVQGAIGKRSEGVFLRLDEKTRSALPQVFRELVQVDERGTATRERARFSRAAKTPEAAALITALTDARLLVQSRGENNEAFVEVAHEALLRSWERLAEWIKDTQDDLRLLRQVRLAAREWDENGRRDDFLWSQERLEPVYAMRERLGVEFESSVLAFVRPETERLLEEFRSHSQYFRQRPIIERFSELGVISIPCAVRALPYAVSKSAMRDLYALLLKHPDKTLPALIEGLWDQDMRPRGAIVQLLASKFANLAIDALMSLMKDKDATIRFYAAAGLINSQNKAVLEILTDGLTDVDLSVRQISAVGLAGLAVPEVVGHLKNALKGDYTLRPLCAYLIGWLGNVDPDDQLPYPLNQIHYSIRLARGTTEEADIIEAALHRSNGALMNNIPQDAIDALIECLNDNKNVIRRGAAQALGMIADPSIIKPLQELVTDQDPGLRNIALEGLANTLHPSVIAILIYVLSNHVIDARLKAAELLGRLGNKSLSNTERIRGKLRKEVIAGAVTSRLRLILDNDLYPALRRQALTSIVQIGDQLALTSVLTAATDKSVEMRALAVTVLAEVGDSSAFPTLIKALDDHHVAVRQTALSTLRKIGDSSVIPPLLARLKRINSDKETEYRERELKISILETFGTLKDNSVLPALETALNDQDGAVRSAAKNALKRLDTPEAMKILKPLMGH
ncbi:MAG TPA: HEAT repeat domain-containing protein [Pyrinomonadaceae bacterium]|nr:HEAT repeat domain-containing protein [Pyrinomonadaceae bacterium]